MHRHPVLVDIDVDEDILRGIEGRPRGPSGNLLAPAGEDRVEDVARRAVPVGPIADDEHPVVAPRLALDPIDRGPEIVERIGHPRHEDMLGGIGGDSIDDSGGRLLRQRPASARHDSHDRAVAGQDRPGQDRPGQQQPCRQPHPPRLKPARRPATGSLNRRNRAGRHTASAMKKFHGAMRPACGDSTGDGGGLNRSV